MPKSNRYFKQLSGLLYLLMLLLVARADSLAEVPANFWKHWGDGKAEVNRYDLEIYWYSEKRSGEATLIYVTEDFWQKRQVKAELERSDDKKLPVLKLNYSKRYLTGIYDYQQMSSIFSPIDSSGVGFRRPLKVSFVSSEWCGNEFAQLNSSPNGYLLNSFSYFDAKSDLKQQFSLDSGVIQEDQLFVLVREQIRPFPAGEYTVFGSPMYSKMFKQPLKPHRARVGRKEQVGGTVYTVKLPARSYRFMVDSSGARRIVEWSIFDSENKLVERASSSGSSRVDYWNKRANADRALRFKLGYR